MKNEIPVTQYLRPDGRTNMLYIPAEGEALRKAKELTEKGCRFTAEVLPGGSVFFDVEKPGGEESITNEICPNDEALPNKFMAMIERAYQKIEAL